MKQLLTIFLVVCLLFSVGCSSKNHFNESSVSETSSYVESQQDKTTTSQAELSKAETLPTNEERRNESEVLAQENVSPQQDAIATTESNNDASKAPTSTTVISTPEKQQPEKQETEQTTPSVSQTPTPESRPSETTTSQASGSDVKEIARLVVEYINQYRAEQGVSPAIVLPGLTKYAEYRSEQLISNFAHDTFDERAAATALKYGEYIEPHLYGMTGEPYYEANVREAIAKAGYSGSVENVSINIAQLVRDSSSHWNYVGSGEYTFIAVGITHYNDMWYCDIAVSRENTDN